MLSQGFFCYLIFTAITLSNIIRRHVANIGNILNMAHFIARLFKHPAQRICKCIGPKITDMRIVIYCRPTRIESDFARIDRLEYLLFFGKGVVELHRITNIE